MPDVYIDGPDNQPPHYSILVELLPPKQSGSKINLHLSHAGAEQLLRVLANALDDLARAPAQLPSPHVIDCLLTRGITNNEPKNPPQRRAR